MILHLIEEKSAESVAAYIAIRAGIILSCWAIMIISTLIDFWSGTTTAKAIGEKLDSKGFRRTLTKDADYMRVMLFALLFDAMGLVFLHFYKLPFVTILCTLSVLIIEGKSVIENSKRKKAHAAKVPEVIKQLVHAATAEKVQNILETINLVTHENEIFYNTGTDSQPNSES